MLIEIAYDYREADMRKLPVEELVRFALMQERRSDNTEVSVSFVDDETIADLNERYRGLARPTDVLSFECDGVDDAAPESIDEDMVFELGDIVIAPDVAERQTHEFATTLEEEVSLLLVHGVLHLCGYDHIEDDEAEIMEAREDEILAAWRSMRSKACASGEDGGDGR